MHASPALTRLIDEARTRVILAVDRYNAALERPTDIELYCMLDFALGFVPCCLLGVALGLCDPRVFVAGLIAGVLAGCAWALASATLRDATRTILDCPERAVALGLNRRRAISLAPLLEGGDELVAPLVCGAVLDVRFAEERVDALAHFVLGHLLTRAARERASETLEHAEARVEQLALVMDALMALQAPRKSGEPVLESDPVFVEYARLRARRAELQRSLEPLVARLAPMASAEMRALFAPPTQEARTCYCCCSAK